MRRRGAALAWALAAALAAGPVLAQGAARPAKKEVDAVGSDAALLARIRAVDPVHAESMRPEDTTFAVAPVAFYRKHKLVRVEVDLPHHPLVLAYADDGSQVLPLSGKPEALYRVNDAEGLQLTEGQVAAYARFFLTHTTNEHGDRREVVEAPGDLDWVKATETEAEAKADRAQASALVRPVAVSGVPGGYRVTAAVVEGVRLIEMVLRVDARGRVTQESTKVLLDGLPVAEKL